MTRDSFILGDAVHLRMLTQLRTG